MFGSLLALLMLAGPLFAEHPETGWIDYTGAASCQSPCHVSGDWTMENMGREMAGSLHFRFKGPVPEDVIFNHDGTTVSGEYGKLNRYCGLPGTMTAFNWLGVLQASNPNVDGGLPGGCARCHAGNGTLPPNGLIEDNWGAIDCLACHAAEYRVNGEEIVNYASRVPIADTSSPTGFRMPLPSGDDLDISSASITASPTTESCQRCHLFAGGGYMNKRGHDFMQDDLHASALSCVDCHETHGHKIAMGRPKPAMWPAELYGESQADHVSCDWCHSAAGVAEHPEWNVPVPEHSFLPGNHLDVLACQTCHIPTNKGLTEKWFDRLKKVVDGDGNFIQWTFQGLSLNNSPEKPEYHWYNGTIFSDVRPRGFMDDPDSRIHPFRRMTSHIPIDDASGLTLPLKLGIIFNASEDMSNMVEQPGDTMALVDKAIRTGAALAATSYPDIYGDIVNEDGVYDGSYHWGSEDMLFSVDHGVMGALSCVQCHDPDGDGLPWLALGYEGDPVFNDVDAVPLPGRFWLGACYPNPFNNATVIPFQLEQAASVTLSIYDLSGRLVMNVLEGRNLPAGLHEESVHAESLASGMYIYRLSAGQHQASGKMMLLK
jgi:hypothetical protein